MININLELRPKLRRPRWPPLQRPAYDACHCAGRYCDKPLLHHLMRNRSQMPPQTQRDIDRVSIDRRRYFAHRTQISTTVDNTYWRRYRELPSRPGVNPWLCLGMIGGGLWGLWMLLN